MEAAEEITHRRLTVWNTYHPAFASLEDDGLVRRPIVPHGCTQNAHMYHLLLPDLAIRTAFIDGMRQQGIATVFHYIPLHVSPAGRKFGRSHGELLVTEDIADRLVRLPLWVGLEEHIDDITLAVSSVLFEATKVNS